MRASWRGWRVGLVGVVALAAGSCGAVVMPAHPAPGARVVHVDCDAASGGDGSRAHPLGSLADANAVELGPGEGLLLRRGSTCTGTLAPQGSGAPGRPVVIGAYGVGAKPRVVGAGDDAVRLENVSHVVLQGLEVTNPGAARRGVGACTWSRTA